MTTIPASLRSVEFLLATLNGLEKANETARASKGGTNATIAIGLPDAATAVAILETVPMEYKWRRPAQVTAAYLYKGERTDWEEIEAFSRRLGEQVKYLLSQAQKREAKAIAQAPTLEHVMNRYRAVATSYELAGLERPYITLTDAPFEAQAAGVLGAIETALADLPAAERALTLAKAKAAAEVRAKLIASERATFDSTRLSGLVERLTAVNEQLLSGKSGEVVGNAAEVVGIEEIALAAVVDSMPDHFASKPRCEDRIGQIFRGKHVNGKAKPTRGELQRVVSDLLRQAEYLLDKSRQRDQSAAEKARRQAEAEAKRQADDAAVAELIASVKGGTAKAVQAAAATVSTAEQLRARLERALGSEAYSTRPQAAARARADFSTATTDDARKAVVQRCENFAKPAKEQRRPAIKPAKMPQKGLAALQGVVLPTPAAPEAADNATVN